MPAHRVTITIEEKQSYYSMIDIDRALNMGQPYTHQIVDCSIEDTRFVDETDNVIAFVENATNILNDTRQKYDFEISMPYNEPVKKSNKSATKKYKPLSVA